MDCREYYSDYYSVIEQDWEAIAPERRGHLRTCPTCRQHIQELEQTLGKVSETPVSHQHLAMHLRLLECATDCGAIKPFLPCLAMDSSPLYVHTPVTAHLEACAACRADYETVRAMGLSDSQLLTASRFLADDAAAGKALPEPVQVVLSEIRYRSSSGLVTLAGLSAQDDALQVETVRIPTGRTTARFRALLKVAASGLAAAMVLMAVLLFVEMPSAGALDLHQFYNALAEVQNLSIVTTVHEETEPAQQIWISQDPRLRLVKSPDKTVLYDLNSGHMALFESVLNDIQVRSDVSIPADLQLPWGLLPFKDVTHIGEGFDWKRLEELSDRQTVVYELSWSSSMAGGRLLEKKWVGYLDRTTCLPEKIEWYERFSNQVPYRLLTTMVITYPETEVVLEAVRRHGFELSYGRQR